MTRRDADRGKATKRGGKGETRVEGRRWESGNGKKKKKKEIIAVTREPENGEEPRRKEHLRRGDEMSRKDPARKLLTGIAAHQPCLF